MTTTPVEPVGAADHLEVWKTRLAALTQVAVFDRDDVNHAGLADLAPDHLIVDVGERAGGALRMANHAEAVQRGWWASVLIVSDSTINCLRIRGRMSPLRFTRLTIDGRLTSPITFDVGDELPAKNDGRWEQRSEWTYVHRS